MSVNLKALIDESVVENERLLVRGSNKLENQRNRELTLKRRFKKGAVCLGVLSVLGFGALGVHEGYKKYNGYVHSEEKNRSYYQGRFDNVKYHFNKKNYFRADELSEKLQDDLDSTFFSPLDDLYPNFDTSL